MKKDGPPFDRSGSNFDSFLEEEGIREKVEAAAVQRVLRNESKIQSRGESHLLGIFRRLKKH